jgi:predicted esterase/catechol 2,3-dioxygenase-like lactoylglutathione lyase family enzyme
MKTNPTIGGIHHITAIASSAVENLAFYENVLGLRLVKKTVNFDDPYTYHLYYGDEEGSPGTIITFFPWEKLPPGKAGAGMITAIAFAIPLDSLDFWRRRLDQHNIARQETLRFGERVIQFKDPHGLALELIGIVTLPSQDDSVAVLPADTRIRGFHSATALLDSLESTHKLLSDIMGMELHGQEQNRHRYGMQGGANMGSFYDVVIDKQVAIGRQGGGTVHHIAFRTPSFQQHAAWQKRLKEKRFEVTPIIDRKYFKSIYFHEPGGVLFEIATDPPGFDIDEAIEELGHTLMLPKPYEPIRTEIEGRLPALPAKGFIHRYTNPDGHDDDGRTFVTLHGTGGNEHDLIPLVRSLSPTSAILSPRGRVLENDMPRFFKRLANNLFDENDVIKQANELADFLVAASSRYRRTAENLIGLGYSNGANIAAAILLLRPEIFSSAILLRPMLPLKKFPALDLSGRKILVLRGKHDQIIPVQSTDRLVEVLSKAKAVIKTVTLEAGHELTAADVQLASNWLESELNPIPVLV